MLSLGYLIVIFSGACLLMLPISTKGESTTFINALFTSTSATCVTGLVAYDTGTHWSIFGQVVILLLIQIGGLGFMTVISVMLRALGKKLSLSQKISISQTTNFNDYTNIKDLVRGIVLCTLIIELSGALLLSIRFIPLFGAGKGIYYSVWHAVSAFCNAGFDVMGGTLNMPQFSSLTYFANDPVVLITIALLISVGGIGFCVIRDVLVSKFKFKKFQLHTKITLLVNTAVIIISALLFLLFERNHTGEGLSFSNQLLLALFNAITPRTAGFNAVELGAMSDSSYVLTICLMFIGGSSGSTAGGIKISTFAIVLFGMRATFRGNKDITIFKRRLSFTQVSTALTILVAYLSAIVVGALAICAIEDGNYMLSGEAITIKAVIYECVSAMGTVGLSLSLSPSLTAISKIILMLLMYAGRVGVVTLGLAIAKSNKEGNIKYPLDNIYIG